MELQRNVLGPLEKMDFILVVTRFIGPKIFLGYNFINFKPDFLSIHLNIIIILSIDSQPLRLVRTCAAQAPKQIQQRYQV